VTTDRAVGALSLLKTTYAREVSVPEHTVASALDHADRRKLDDGAALFAVGFLVASVATYPFLSEQPALPLAVFAVPPLICATLSSPSRTALIAGASVIASIGFGIWLDITVGQLLWRIAVIVLISALAVASAWLRTRSQRRLSAASATVELHTAFQRGLAPKVAPPRDVVVATRYIAGEERMHLGGDFFDAVGLPTGDLAFVVGDVAGHGPYEAAIGAALRAGWKSAAFSSPCRPLDWINLLAIAFLGDRRFEEFVTMCTGRLEVPTGRVELISAGHVWPVVIRDRAEVVQMIPGPPLGVDLPRDWRVTDLHLDPGEALFVFTDGLTESRVTGRRSQRWGEEGLIRWMNGKLNRDRTWRPDLDELLAQFADNGTFADDVAVMLIQTSAKTVSSGATGSGAASADGSAPDAGARVSATSAASFREH
jgi:hypothetical protein